MKIASTVGLRAPQRALVERAVPGAEIVDRQCRTVEEMAELVGSANGCDVLFTFRVPPETMRIAPQPQMDSAPERRAPITRSKARSAPASR